MDNIVGLFGSPLTTILFVVGFVAVAVVAWWLRGLFGTKNIVRSSTLLTAVKDANEMVTLRSYFQHIIQNTLETNLIVMTSESKLLLICKGEIVCHFDMSKASITVDEESRKISVGMPTCELQTIIDTKNVEVYDSTRGVVDFIADTIQFKHTYDYNKVRDVIESERPKITQAAKEEWRLVDKAKDNAKRNVANLAQAFGYTADVSFEDNNDSAAKLGEIAGVVRGFMSEETTID